MTGPTVRSTAPAGISPARCSKEGGVTAPQTQPSRFGWLVSNFAERVPGWPTPSSSRPTVSCSPAPTGCPATAPTSSRPSHPVW